MRSIFLNRFLLLSTLFTPVAIAAPASQTACISMQGNGERYPALIAQVLALLERNVEPKMIFGGSSASGAAALLRGILENPSVKNTVVIAEGRELSLAEKAARIVATTPGPIGTVLVLPGLNKLGHSIDSAVKYVGADQLAQAFIGYPDQSIANLEAAVGQITLLSEFFAVADFSSALQEGNLVKRSALVQKDWLAFSDMLLVSPKEFIRALITAPGDARWSERSEAIKKRYFDLFYDEQAKPEDRPDPSRQRYNQLLKTLQPIISRIPDNQLEQAFLSSISLLKGLPFVSYTAVVASKPFYLANGERVQNAYKGKTSDGQSRFEIPSGVLIHTTARVATAKRGGGLVERDGLENFYQTYFPSQDLYSNLLSARNDLGEGRSFLEFTDELGVVRTAVDKNKLLVMEPRTLAEALKASIAEPNAFRRDPLALTAQDLATNSLNLGQDKLVSFGGWMEHANRRTIGSLDTCANVDYLVEVSTLSQGLYSFQLKAIRAVIAGGTGSLVDRLNGTQEKADEASKLWMNDLWKAYTDSRSVREAEQSLALDFDWDNASGLEGAAAAAMNPAYDANRNAFFVAAYQDAYLKLEQNAAAPRSAGAQLIIGADLNRMPLKSITNPTELNAAVDAILQ